MPDTGVLAHLPLTPDAHQQSKVATSPDPRIGTRAGGKDQRNPPIRVDPENCRFGVLRRSVVHAHLIPRAKDRLIAAIEPDARLERCRIRGRLNHLLTRDRIRQYDRAEEQHRKANSTHHLSMGGLPHPRGNGRASEIARKTATLDRQAVPHGGHCRGLRGHPRPAPIAAR